jgi:mRNA interferase YafQ
MTMLEFQYSSIFKKDIKQAVFQGRDIMKIFPPLVALLNGRPLPERYRDHPLKGKWLGYRDFHIEPDWVVIYKILDGCVYFTRTGTHADVLE